MSSRLLIMEGTEWPEGVYMCQADACEIISLSDHSFQSYDKKFRCWTLGFV